MQQVAAPSIRCSAELGGTFTTHPTTHVGKDASKRPDRRSSHQPGRAESRTGRTYYLDESSVSVRRRVPEDTLRTRRPLRPSAGLRTLLRTESHGRSRVKGYGDRVRGRPRARSELRCRPPPCTA